MQLQDFHFNLPDELIARYPTEQRSASRLLRLNGESGEVDHSKFFQLVDFLEPNGCQRAVCGMPGDRQPHGRACLIRFSKWSRVPPPGKTPWKCSNIVEVGVHVSPSTTSYRKTC